MFRFDTPLFEFRGPWGVPVQIRSSLLLLVLIVLLFPISNGALLDKAVVVGMLLLSLMAHELGHVAGNLMQHRPVRRVTLFGGGGFCERGMGVPPQEEELVVLMGPLVNAAIWVGCLLLTPFLEGEAARLVILFGKINLFLLAYNMLPVMPLDGGKLTYLMLLRFVPPGWAMSLCGALGLLVMMLWLPGLVFTFYTFGLFLLFLPPLVVHWEMLRQSA